MIQRITKTEAKKRLKNLSKSHQKIDVCVICSRNPPIGFDEFVDGMHITHYCKDCIKKYNAGKLSPSDVWKGMLKLVNHEY